MKKVALYIMSSKGYYVLEEFIKNFGSCPISYIVSCEDKNVQKDFFNEIKILAEKEEINFFTHSENIEKEFNGFRFAISWKWIIEDEKNLIIFHDSILPKYRGFAPLVNCLINNEKKVGVTALFASSEYDKGNIISKKSFEINYPIKIEDVINKIQPLYFELVSDIFTDILNNEEIKSTEQDDTEATYSSWLDSEDYFIDWSWNAKKIKRFVDAVGYPYDNAKAYLEGRQIIKFININIVQDVVVENRERHIGKVIFIRDGVPIVVCNNGLIGLKDIRDESNEKIKINFRSRFK